MPETYIKSRKDFLRYYPLLAGEVFWREVGDLPEYADQVEVKISELANRKQIETILNDIP